MVPYQGIDYACRTSTLSCIRSNPINYPFSNMANAMNLYELDGTITTDEVNQLTKMLIGRVVPSKEKLLKELAKIRERQKRLDKKQSRKPTPVGQKTT